MSEFAQALRAYRSGTSSREELLSEVDRGLAERRAAGSLLAMLASEHARNALPIDIHDEITRKINHWLRAHEIVRPRKLGWV